MKTDQKVTGLPSLALVFGYIAVKELQSTNDRIRLLDRLGYGNKEISIICDISINTVAVQKSLLKRKRGSKAK